MRDALGGADSRKAQLLQAAALSNATANVPVVSVPVQEAVRTVAVLQPSIDLVVAQNRAAEGGPFDGTLGRKRAFASEIAVAPKNANAGLKVTVTLVAKAARAVTHSGTACSAGGVAVQGDTGDLALKLQG